MAEYDFYTAINEMVQHCQTVLHSKHDEYATEDHFHNFNVTAVMNNKTPEEVLAIMMDKHVVSVHDLVNEHAEGRTIPPELWKEKIGDNINYLLILWAMVGGE